MITQCRSCGSDRLNDVLSLGEQYLSDFVPPDFPKPPKHPIDLVICKDCDLVQLHHNAPTSELYSERYGYRSGINQTMRDHLQEIVEQSIFRQPLQYNDVVVDIGANDGTLLSNYNGMYRVAFEPIQKFCDGMYREKRAELIINDFFNAEKFMQYCGDQAKIITAISMFYDLENPNKFVGDIVKILHPQGLFVIQQNYLVTMLQNLAYDNIVHEHLEYYSLTSLEKLLNRHGLEVIDVEVNDLNGGSIRTYIRHMDALKKLRFIERKMKLDSQWPYLVFAMHVKHVKKELVEFIKGEVKKGKTIYVLGASTRGNTLLQYCGLDNKLITAAVERNEEKWGKKIASVDIPIVSEEQARKDKPDYMLVLPWFFADEIKKREAEYVKNGGALVFPLPKLEVYRG